MLEAHRSEPRPASPRRVTDNKLLTRNNISVREKVGVTNTQNWEVMRWYN